LRDVPRFRTTPPARLNTLMHKTCLKGANVVPSVTAASSGACCDACRVEPACKVWNWAASTKLCSFKKEGYFKQVSNGCTAGKMSG